jgi:DUF917 family protein
VIFIITVLVMCDEQGESSIFKVVSQYWLGGIEEDHLKPLSG